jgi:hypothetical protein
MNHTYRLYQNLLLIEESADDSYTWSFSFRQLKNNENNLMSDEHLQSYNRTKNWMLQNYPELLL